MSTFPCSVKEFNAQFCNFQKISGDKTKTQDQVALAYKCLALHYLGVQNATEKEIEACAMYLEIASVGAYARGWHLIEPDIG
jgi:hypothetical protein